MNDKCAILVTCVCNITNRITLYLVQRLGEAVLINCLIKCFMAELYDSIYVPETEYILFEYLRREKTVFE